MTSHTELEFKSVRLTGWKALVAVYMALFSFGIFCASLGVLIARATRVCG